MIPDFYTADPAWAGDIERIVELLGRISAVEELSGRAPELRRTNRISSVHSSTAIEGNELTLAQVEGVANGEPVFAPPRQVKEVENALAAYDALRDLDPWSVDDFLRAHGLLTAGLIRAHQDGYYAALQASREPEIEASVFIDYMFGVITESLESYEANALAAADVGANVGRNVGVSDAVLALLRVEPTLSAAAIAGRLGKTPRTVERHLADLKAAGRLHREGPAKKGRWVVSS